MKSVIGAIFGMAIIIGMVSFSEASINQENPVNRAIVARTGEVVDDEYMETLRVYFEERKRNFFGETISDTDWVREEQIQRIDALSRWESSCSFKVKSVEVTPFLSDLLERTEKESIFLVSEYNQLHYQFDFEETTREMDYETFHVIHMSNDDFSILAESYVEMCIGYSYGKDNEIKYILAFGEIPWDEAREENDTSSQEETDEVKISICMPTKNSDFFWGMSEKEVVSILGEPAKTDSFDSTTECMYHNLDTIYGNVDAKFIYSKESLPFGGEDDQELGLVKLDLYVDGLNYDSVEALLYQAYGSMEREISNQLPQILTDIQTDDSIGSGTIYTKSGAQLGNVLSPEMMSNLSKVCQEWGKTSIDLENQNIFSAVLTELSNGKICISFNASNYVILKKIGIIKDLMDDLKSLVPNSYPDGEVQTIYTYYNETLYRLDAAILREEVDLDKYTFLGKIITEENSHVPDKEMFASHLPAGTDIYQNTEGELIADCGDMYEFLIKLIPEDPA